MSETLKVILVAVLSGGIGAGILKLIGDQLAWKREREAKKEDNKEKLTSEHIEQLEADVKALKESQKYILYDRIRFLALEYTKEGEIDFDDRRILKNMHNSYHYGLGGNGDLDDLMKKVEDLPLKLK